MRKLQQINKSQLVKLLDAISCEGIDNQYWAVNSYEYRWKLTRRTITATKICRENTVQIIARLQLIGCGINSDVLTSMKPIIALAVVRLKPTSVMQSMRHGLGSIQAS